jgi:Sulfotransferase domain
VTLKVVGAGVGRTGTHSLKMALEQLLGGKCHHMVEVFEHPEQIPVWTDAVAGKPVDWATLLSPYRSLVDWPGASFWPELLAANPDALVLLSVRDPEEWYRSASNTIFLGLDNRIEGGPPEMSSWMDTVRRLLRDRFSDRFDDETAMLEAFQRHNAMVRDTVPAGQLLEWTPCDGWAPICDRLGLAIPEQPFPLSNTSEEFRQRFGIANR